jgi:hypothetical protein
MQFIDQLVNQYRPNIERAGHTATAYAERIIERLDTLIEYNAPDDFTEFHRWEVAVLTGVFTLQDVRMVPMGQTWELQAVSFMNANGLGGRTTVENNGNIIAIADSASAGAAAVGVGFIIPAGSNIQVQGAAVGTRVHMQFKVKRPAAPRANARGAGRVEASGQGSVDAIDPRTSAQREGRHSAPGVREGAPVVGERHG